MKYIVLLLWVIGVCVVAPIVAKAAVVTIYDQNGVPHQYVIPDDNSGPLVPVAVSDDGRLPTIDPRSVTVEITCPKCGHLISLSRGTTLPTKATPKWSRGTRLRKQLGL